jgi:hypothetical protein
VYNTTQPYLCLHDKSPGMQVMILNQAWSRGHKPNKFVKQYTDRSRAIFSWFLSFYFEFVNYHFITVGTALAITRAVRCRSSNKGLNYLLIEIIKKCEPIVIHCSWPA